ncbi:uncharacterized protein LOC110808564 [Carica papaya]|uniref:uncharacterized protein LOC110808564 n=1 Tax=Carica papaya TaxID=3649 RepID=UPI000B8CC778|nr:uncharacterized protein LOC110808564 [Carica papaya]
MKTVSGKVISTAPISLSKAASIISNFAAAENGASQAISAYVRRASAAFTELAHLHKELKYSSKSSGKRRWPKPDVSQEQNPPTRIDADGEPNHLAELSQERSQGENIEGGKHRNKKKKERGEFDDFVKNEDESAGVKFEIEGEEKLIPLGRGERSHEVEGLEGVDKERKKHKKKKIKNEDDGVENVKFVENECPIGKTRDGVKMEILAESREEKKEGEEAYEGEDLRSEERRSKKKRRRKSEEIVKK